MKNNKIRLALICHLSNPMIRENLALYPSCRFVKYKDFANWNSNIINSLRERDDVELHVISPHIGMRNKTQIFKHEGVTYYFFSTDLPLPWSILENHFYPQSKRGFPRNRKAIQKFVQMIQPELINLIGAENSYYSIAALDIENIPIIIHLQTVYANPARKKNSGKVNQRRWDLELQIFHKTPYMACSGQMYYDLVKQYEPNAIVFPRKWPVAEFPKVPEVQKKYDFAYSARFLSKNKGFDAAIEAIAEFAKVHPDVSFIAVGNKDGNWPSYEKRINELGLQNNIIIHPPFVDYLDVLKYVKQARFALLPITMDVISGTILEAMRMGMPVVTCRTSGTPSLNKKRETVLISEIGDYHQLANLMLDIYEHPDRAEMLRKNGLIYIEELDEKESHNVDSMVAQYKAVIEHYHNGTPIPQELLF